MKEDVGTSVLDIRSARYEHLPKAVKILLHVFTVVGVGLGVIAIFGISIRGKALLDVAYFFLLFAMFAPASFLLMEARKNPKHARPQWYDFLLAALSFGIALYFYYNAWNIRTTGWVPPPSLFVFILAFVYCLLALEASRRFAGPIFAAIAALLGVYPLVAGHLPGLFFGYPYSLFDSVAMYVFGSQGMLGIPATVLGNILLGFLLFAAALLVAGAGDFFLKLATCLLGKARGGPAKVSLFSCGLFGTLTGEAVASIVALGPICIPSMKKVGYSPTWAAAIQACGAIGAVLMPPVMGAAVFVMCVMLELDYVVVMGAAIIPAILFYFGMYMQVDAHAARMGIKGLPPEEVPPLKTVLKEGWVFIFAIAFLVWGFAYMRWQYMTPYYASGLVLLLSFVRRKTMMTPKKMLELIKTLGNLLSQITAVLLPLGILICALIVTGFSGSLSGGLIHLAGGHLVPILLVGVAVCYLFGMAGMMISAYILLAITMAPAIIALGLNPLAVHLFIIYFTMIAVITPPVCGGVFVSSAIAGSPPMSTGWLACRVAIVIYLIPFFFVFNPALILQGSSLLQTSYSFALCVVGIVLIAAGLEGYLWKVGMVPLWARVPLVAGGFMIALPGWRTSVIGVIIAAAVIVLMILIRRKQEALPTT